MGWVNICCSIRGHEHGTRRSIYDILWHTNISLTITVALRTSPIIVFLAFPEVARCAAVTYCSISTFSGRPKYWKVRSPKPHYPDDSCRISVHH